MVERLKTKIVDLPFITKEPVFRTNRGFRYYCKVFDYGPNGEQLRGKKILDLGAGDSDFASKANLEYQAEVVVLDASYTKYPPEDKKDKINAVTQALPFKSSVFDEVIASHSIIYIAEENLRQTIEEMLRVTKNGGKIKIYPVYLRECPSRDDLHELSPHISLLLPTNVYSFLTLEIRKEISGAQDFQDLLNKLLHLIDFDPRVKLLRQQNRFTSLENVPIYYHFTDSIKKIPLLGNKNKDKDKLYHIINKKNIFR